MKYIVILGDGMADEPQESLGGKTVIEAAKTPVMDEISKTAEIGLFNSIPEGMKPGSDTANLSVMGYNPKIYYTGRSPLESLSIGVDMKETDISMRCNIVTITDEQEKFEDKIIVDHSSSEISTEDAKVLLDTVVSQIKHDHYEFYLGTQYRHCVIWENGVVQPLAQPHDHLTEVIGQYLPEDKELLRMMKESYAILRDHPINVERKAKGLNPANCFWFWGAGTKPMISSFEEKYGLKGTMISAVDLLKGIAIGAKMSVKEVEGANAGLYTNYEGKAQAAVDALLKDGLDFAYIHLEAPDEMGHQGSLDRKIMSVENLDQRIIKIVKEQMDASGEEYRMLILPDHPTPVRIRTHTSDPVPYMLYDSRKTLGNGALYSEKNAAASGIVLTESEMMMDRLLERD